jgi:protein-L-isoaspartate(D-aspartate) O-methyltransferase
MLKDKDVLIKQLKKEGFSEEITSAFNNIKREEFVPERAIPIAYRDVAISLEENSTISQPSTIAFVLKLSELKQNQKILEIGSGSGYLLALISEIIKTGKIYGIEINLSLAIKSKKTLEKDSNIEIINQSGAIGFDKQSPYDRIIISFALENKTQINPLLSQLKDDGIIVAPIGDSLFQFKKESGRISEKEFKNYRFVPMIK